MSWTPSWWKSMGRAPGSHATEPKTAATDPTPTQDSEICHATYRIATCCDFPSQFQKQKECKFYMGNKDKHEDCKNQMIDNDVCKSYGAQRYAYKKAKETSDKN